MSRSLKIYQGEDETPVVDVTEPSSDVHVIWEEVEAGGRAYRGESNLGSFPMRDERGETGSELNLPAELTHISLSAGSRIEWLVTDSSAQSHRLFRGRIGPKDYSRGRQKANRAREVVVSANDTNYDLRNIIVDGWSRPEETDVARVQALITAYLSGSPRASTVISDDYVATGSNTVTLGPKVYDATSPAEVLSEIATVADKLHFVTIDDELFYDGYDSSAYQAGVRISDRVDEIDTSARCAPGGVALEDSTGELGVTEIEILVPEDLVDSALYLWITDRSDLTNITAVTWDPDVGSSQNFTKVDEVDGNPLNHVEVWRLLSPNPSPISPGLIEVTGSNDAGLGVMLLTGVDQSDPDSGFTSATGVSSSSSLTITTPADGLAIDVVTTWDNDVLLTDGPTPSGGEAWSDFHYTASAATRDKQWGGSYGDSTPSWTLAASQNWLAVGLAVNASGSSSVQATFPPIWDVGPSSTEDGMELLSGLRLYYGQGSNTYVYVNDPVTANQYWHSEQSLYTNDPLINTAAKATTLAQAILQHRKVERRTYNVSIGPLTADQVGCLKPGHLIDIKARAIPDADDNFVTRRIAQLRWTTPVPGTYFAHMMLDRPMKDSPSGIGPKQSTDSINRHVEQGSNSHPEYVLRGTLTTQGDLPYRGASDWTRLGIGASNTQLVSTGQVPIWAPKDAAGGGGAPTTADYLVGTANGSLSAEIVVGTTPGGELGGTWASPTVDAVHSGSAHLALGTSAGTAAEGDHTHGASTGYYRPVMDGYGNVVTDSGTGAALMAYAED